MFTDVSTLSNVKISCSIHSLREKCISIRRVREVGFCTLAMAVHASLSSYNNSAADCGMPRFHKTLQTKRMSLPSLHALMNSASVDYVAIVGMSEDLYAIVPPASRR